MQKAGHVGVLVALLLLAVAQLPQAMGQIKVCPMGTHKNGKCVCKPKKGSGLKLFSCRCACCNRGCNCGRRCAQSSGSRKQTPRGRSSRPEIAFEVADSGTPDEYEEIFETEVEAAAYICNGDFTTAEFTSGSAASELTVSIAASFANAVTLASLELDADGQLVEPTDVESLTQNINAAAEQWMERWSEGVAEAAPCDVCEGYAESFGYMRQQFLLAAVSEAKPLLDAYLSPEGESVADKSILYEDRLVEILSKTLVQPFEGARSFSVAEGCMAWVNEGGCIWSPSNPDPNFCATMTFDPEDKKGPEEPEDNEEPAKRKEPEACAENWGQCGGRTWKGPTCCSGDGFTCVTRKNNPYYSQCRRG